MKLKRIGVDYGRVWHLADEDQVGYFTVSLCGKPYAKWNRPDGNKVCSVCLRISRQAQNPSTR